MVPVAGDRLHHPGVPVLAQVDPAVQEVSCSGPNGWLGDDDGDDDGILIRPFDVGCNFQKRLAVRFKALGTSQLAPHRRIGPR